MNVCCGSNLGGKPDLTNDEIFLNLEKTTLKFNEEKGVFTIFDIQDESSPLKKKKDEIRELKHQIKQKEKEIKDYKAKIEEINAKLENMDKILLMDEKEQQYIFYLAGNNN